MTTNLSTQLSLEKRTHREFSIFLQNDHNTILEDSITKLTYAYKKLNLSVGERVILYIKDLDLFTRRPSFQHSILNDYKEGVEYEFDVIKKHEKGFSIENIEDFSLFMPLSFEKLIANDKIKLTIEKIDVKSNKIYYKHPNTSTSNKNTFQNKQLPSELFKVGEKYVFNVKGIETISEEVNVLKLELNGFQCTVKSFDFQNKDTIPTIITCYVKQILGNNIYLVQDKYSLFNKLFKEGENYDFTIIDKEIDKNSIEYYSLKDKFGFYHKLYHNDFLEDALSEDDINSVKSFHIRKINEQGFLTIYLNTERVKGKFYTVEHVFKQAGITESIKELFYDLKSELSNDKYSKFPFTDLFEDYDNQENLWFFSYLSFLQKYIRYFIYNEDYPKALYFTEIYIKLEEWMIEGSHFLTLFSNDKREDIMFKAENQIIKSFYQIEALKIIIDGKSENFIQEILNKLRHNGNLEDDTVSTFKFILYTSQDIIYKSTEDVIEIVLLLIENDRLDDYDIVNFISVLERKNKNEKYELNSSLLFKSNKLDNRDKEKVRDIVKIQALLINFNKQGFKKSFESINTANLYHYLSLLTDDVKQKKNLLVSAIEAITKNKNIEVTSKQIRNLDINSFISKKREKTEDISMFEAQFIYSNKGAVYQYSGGLAFISSQQYYYFQNQDIVPMIGLGGFINNNLIIATPLKSFKSKLCNLSSPDEYKRNWGKLYSDVEAQEVKENKILNKKTPQIGTVVNIVTKNYLNNNSDVIFAKIESEEYEGEGILHILNVSRVRLNGLHGVLWPGKRLQAEVIENNKKGLSFSIIDDVWWKMKSIVKIDDVVNAKIVDIKEQYNLAFLITENGCFAQTSLDDLSNKTSIGDIFKFKISDVLDIHKYFVLRFISDGDVEFNEKEVFKNFLTENIIFKSINGNSERNDVSSEKYKRLINELIVILTEYNHLQNDILKKIEYNYLLKLLSSLLKSSKSYYFDAQINYLSTVYHLKEIKYNESFSKIDLIPDETLSIYKKLEIFNDKYEILRMLNKIENISELSRMIDKKQTDETSKLSKLVLAHNILASEIPDDEILLTHTKNLIYENLSNEKTDILQFVTESEGQEFGIEDETIHTVTNLGKEGKYREFKTSFIYYAGTHSLNIEEQSFIILKTIAGFLNAEGGSLFIGVKDNGDVSGLIEEYLHFGDIGNSDKYERFIRKYIVDSFNKDVNSQIEFKFMLSENNEYVEIVIPEYEKPVPLANDFFQRQGNETRILKGNDLVLFFERKIRNIDSTDDNLKNQKEEFIRTNQIETQNELNLFGEQKIKITGLSETEKLENSGILAYLYFFNNGTYILSKQLYNNKNIKHSLSITSVNKKGFLIQGYDNGCVNKVDVRALLGKRFGYSYNNGFSREGNLILLEIINEEALIQINSIRNSIEYIKVFDTKNISTHNMLHLKGNNIIQTGYDRLLSMKIIKNSFKQELSRVIYNSKQTIGKSTNSNLYKNEFNLLDNLI